MGNIFLEINNNMEDNSTCLSQQHNSKLFTHLYEGIPETLGLNVIAWIVLLLLFAILRNRAWDYGRLALVQNEKWMQLFYKNTEEALPAEEINPDTSLAADVGCLWLPTIFKINKQKVFARCGPDAAHYLSFQRHLICLMFIITLVAICIILPVNFQGNLQGDAYTFGHTTISNLDANSTLLWIHVLASFCLVPLTVFVMRHCSSRIPNATLLTSSTVMVTHISHKNRNTEDIRNYFSMRFPTIEIKDVKIAYKIKKLMSVENDRVKVTEARNYIVSHNKGDMKLHPYGCVVCCSSQAKNALQFYTDEEERLTNLVAQERRVALSSPLGIAFVTVDSEEAANYIISTFQPGTVRHWNMSKAASPSDINWENLEISTRNWYIKAITLNVFLFIVLFFLTTPAVIINLLYTYTSVQEKVIKKFSPVVSEFLPTLLLLSMSALLPVIVAYSDQGMSHWTKSKQNLSIMHKTFFFLLFMVLILPSLGLTSAQAFVEWSLQPTNNTFRWDCIFLADKGAFFVNYVITSSLIGTALELLRFPELAMYVWRLLTIKSDAEKVTIQKEILSIFPFGVHYTWTLLIFTITTVYSLICPLITPFGLLYLCLKHLVDKHNIYYVYRPITMCGEGQQIHSSAVRMVRVAVVLLQLILAAFAILRSSVVSYMAIVIALGLVTTCSCFFFLSPFPSCRRSPTSAAKYPEPHEQYIAPVLLSSQNLPVPTPTQTDYGSNTFDENELSRRMSQGVSIA